MLAVLINKRRNDPVLPAEDSEYEVEHEEGANHDEGHKIDRAEIAPHRVIRLKFENS